MGTCNIACVCAPAIVDKLFGAGLGSVVGVGVVADGGAAVGANDAATSTPRRGDATPGGWRWGGIKIERREGVQEKAQGGGVQGVLEEAQKEVQEYMRT